MRSKLKPAKSAAEHALFGDEEAAAMQAEIGVLRGLVEDLGRQVNSQFTTIAAHAEIARQQAEFIRAEADANLERTRDILIGLIEQIRKEVLDTAFGPARGGTRAPAPWAPPGPSTTATAERVAELETLFASASERVDYCLKRQHELAGAMEALLDTVIFEPRGEPVLRLA